MLKYSINRMLSKTTAVAVLDCDVGQAEFTIPGVISLHIITSPILRPSYLNMLPPLTSYFVGDVTIKGDPLSFQKALFNLFKDFNCVRDHFHKTGEISLVDRYERKCEDNTEAQNTFSILDDSDMQLHSLPLLVNTDGWIRNLGADNLCYITKLVDPTDFVHFTTGSNERPLDAISILSPACVVHTLMSSAPSQPKVTAVDMRSLRYNNITVYFVYSTSLLVVLNLLVVD